MLPLNDVLTFALVLYVYCGITLIVWVDFCCKVRK